MRVEERHAHAAGIFIFVPIAPKRSGPKDLGLFLGFPQILARFDTWNTLDTL